MDLQLTNVGDCLPQMAARIPSAIAIYAATARRAEGKRIYESITYQALNERAEQYARGLLACGLVPGARVVMMVPPSIDFLALTFGLFRAGLVPVMLDPAMGAKALTACIKLANPHGFVGIPRAQIARIVLGWRGAQLNHIFCTQIFPGSTSTRAVLQAGQTSSAGLPSVSLDDIAAILFTSGSTGMPKGAVYTNRNFLAQVEIIRLMYNIQPGEIDMPTFPLFALFDPALGMTTVLPLMDFSKPGKVDPDNLVEAISDQQVTSMFGSPALIARLATTDAKLPTLQRILCAGAPVRTDVMQNMLAHCAPSCFMHTPYGATESLPVASISNVERTDLDAKTATGDGVCVGHPVSAARVQIIKIVDGVLASMERLSQGEIGEICVSGAQVTQTYWADETQTNLHKIRDEQGQLWHRVGDVGYFDEQGRLWFCGRKAHRVQLKNCVLYSEQVEGVASALGLRAALIAGTNNEAWLCIENEVNRAAHNGTRIRFDRDACAQRLVDRLVDSRFVGLISRVLWVPEFPVDARHNAKIRREDLQRDREMLARRYTWFTLPTKDTHA